jgi:3D (Asp-Asp-Asp) domain-containing protein
MESDMRLTSILLALLFAAALLFNALPEPTQPTTNIKEFRQFEAPHIVEQPSRGMKVLVMEATAYCHGTRTATGTKPTPGRTVAADPSILPYGTELIIDGVPGYVVEDCGGDIRGARLDIFVEDYATAINFGRRTVEVRILE